jgi:hypothetical protein
MMAFQQELMVFKSLAHYRLFSESRRALDKLINWAIWTTGMLVVMGYLMQSFGLSEDFGVFQLAGIFAVIGIFEGWETLCIDLLVDMDNDNLFGYHATLACSFSTVLLAYIAVQTVVGVALCVYVFCLGKLILWNSFTFSQVSWLALIVAVVVSCIMSAILALWFDSFVRTAEKLGNMWQRMIWPMWFFGGFQFSFAATLAKWPLFAYLMLVSPITYATEGVRRALLGGNYLNTWLCIGAMIVISVVLFFDCVRRYKRWLDLI